MNIAIFLFLLVTGFGTSFLVLDISRIAARGHWPMADGAIAERFRVFPVFLALFAGPALFAGSTVRMRMSGALSLVEVAVACVIAFAWACCYGLVVAQSAWLLLSGSPLGVGQ